MIGARIRTRRSELGMSLRALAKEVDLTASFLSQLEREQADPSIKSLRRIADALKVPLFYFLAEEGETNPVVRKDARKRLQLPGSKVICELMTPSVRSKMQVFGMVHRSVIFEGVTCGHSTLPREVASAQNGRRKLGFRLKHADFHRFRLDSCAPCVYSMLADPQISLAYHSPGNHPRFSQ